MAGPLTGEERPGMRRLFVCSSPEELARAAAGRLWGIVRERGAAQEKGKGRPGGIAVALSGGATPRRFLETLAASPYRERFPWNRVHFFQTDERWVPPDDPRSNQRMLRESLVAAGPVPEGNFHPVDLSLPDPAASARRYEEHLRRFFPKSPGGFPRFDAVFLGIGSDGHTASLFPGSPVLEERKAWVAHAEGGAPSLGRVTLTLPVLNNAFRVIFLASGEEKAEILRVVLQGEGTGSLPAARVSPRQGRVTWLVDSTAASALPSRGSSPPGNGGDPA